MVNSRTILVHGLQVDDNTGCAHYRSSRDIVAIKFKCCDLFYACYECHQAALNHDPIRWQPDEFNTPAVLCGRCKELLTIHEYLTSESSCPRCSAPFNPRCKYHWNLYFEGVRSKQ